MKFGFWGRKVRGRRSEVWGKTQSIPFEGGRGMSLKSGVWSEKIRGRRSEVWMKTQSIPFEGGREKVKSFDEKRSPSPFEGGRGMKKTINQ